MDSVTNKYLLNAKALANPSEQGIKLQSENANTSSQPLRDEPNNSKKINKTLAALGILGAAAVAVAVAVAKTAKGKNPELNSALKFFTKSGDEVQGAFLKGGKAIMQDGTSFSGIMETVNKKGDKIKINFQDGFMSESYKNDTLFKTYDTLEGIPSKILAADSPKYPRTQGTKISLVEDELPKEFYYHIFDKDGRVNRSVKYSTQKAFDAIDIQDGMISSRIHTEKLSPRGELYSGGALSASISKDKGLNTITKYLDDGTTVVTGGKLEDYDLIMTRAADYKIKNPQFAKYYRQGDIVAQNEITLDKKNPITNVLKSISRSGDTLRTLEIELPVNMNIPGKKLIIELNENNAPYARAVFVLKDGQPFNTAALDETKTGYLKSCVLDALNKAKENGFDFDCDKVAQFIASLG